MTLEQIKEKAADLGILPGRMGKTDLIRAIQKAEGATGCFATGSEDCPYVDCCFREDCLAAGQPKQD
jgi:hypothetical protein